MKKLIYPIVCAVLFYMQFLFYSCADNSPGNVNDNDSIINEYYDADIELYMSYTHPSTNPNKPLGNSPIPFGIQPIQGQFQGIIQGSVTKADRNLETGSEYLLSYPNPNSFFTFFLNYGAYNNVNRVYSEAWRIHVFGVTEFPQMPAAVRGVTYPINMFNNDFPAMSFINVGRTDSVLKVAGLTEDNRKKYICCYTAHEIGHARGLIDNNHGSADTSDDVHWGHSLDDPWCNMSWSVSWDDGDISHRYPPLFCCRHKRIFSDSMSNKIRGALSIPHNYLINCN